MTDQGNGGSLVMLAAYRVDVAKFDSFLAILKEAETLYRAHEVVTTAPVMRLQSIENPEFIVELIEWRSAQHLSAVMENEAIMAKWSQIKASWKDGDMGLNRVPEANVPWAVMRPIS